VIGYALVTSIIVGIARAWEFVGQRKTGLRASIAVLAGHEPGPDGAPAPEAAAPPEPGAAPGREPGDRQADERDE
jgi:hypothetical protein